MDQRKKFNRKAAGWRVKQLFCWALSLSLAPVALAETLLSNPQAELTEKPTKDRLAPLKARLAKQYPDVEHLSIEGYLADYPKAVLVDVRAADEYAVSRIPGAVNIEDRAELLTFAREHRDSQLILYCSVGARSADAARFLQEQHSEEALGAVANLAGSIFEWANEERPLENDAGPTSEVHPFNAWWGWLYLD